MRKLLFALLLCGMAGLANAQTASTHPSNPQVESKTGRASFTAKMEKAPVAQPATVTNPGSHPGFHAVMDKKPAPAPAK